MAMLGILSFVLFIFYWISTENQAKNQAKKILKSHMLDPRIKIDKVLKILSASWDNEGKRLFNQLSDFVEGK